MTNVGPLPFGAPLSNQAIKAKAEAIGKEAMDFVKKSPVEQKLTLAKEASADTFEKAGKILTKKNALIAAGIAAAGIVIAAVAKHIKGQKAEAATKAE